MACLQHPDRDQPVYLMAHHTVGRRQGVADTRITLPEISGIHAAIQWTGSHWVIRDLSRNGTWVNGQQLIPAKNQQLQVGDKITFGRANNPVWRMENLDPPENLLIDIESGESQPLESYHLLPDEHDPIASLHFNPINGVWIYELLESAENSESARVVNHGSRIDCAHNSWELFLGNSQSTTTELSINNLCVSDFRLRFSVSHHEEHIQLQLAKDDMKLDLAARTHNYLLLYLARARIRDIQRKVDHSDQGWVAIDLATRELGITVNHLNTQIFRARKQIADSLPDAIDTSRLVERRAYEMRLGCNQLDIFKGSQKEVLEATSDEHPIINTTTGSEVPEPV
ncbi:FHA domain-containing protein [Microbulbifer sp. CAU 1566]|uniref:FHA domain-containing protein n=1 Tax=unclassified Microbulbifer TaxID=2619833 RepID=UPI0013567A3B|nr:MULTISPECIES: FHA domain-containing protein [unclassified Microbulbifer]MCK7596256.1 FHA domain-containing protein [Microbulbifer sp. CAU 1566]